MADFVTESDKSARDQLKEKIIDSGNAAFDPASSVETRASAQREFQALIEK